MGTRMVSHCPELSNSHIDQGETPERWLLEALDSCLERIGLREDSLGWEDY